MAEPAAAAAEPGAPLTRPGLGQAGANPPAPSSRNCVQYKPAKSVEERDRLIRFHARAGEVHFAILGKHLLAMDGEKGYLAFGYPSITKYARAAIGFKPRKTKDLMRIARRLQDLPLIANAFAEGEITFSKVREITRVATPTCEVQWLEYAKTMTADEVEAAVASKPRGAEPPEDGLNEPGSSRRFTMTLPEETYYVFQRALRKIMAESKGKMSQQKAMKTIADIILHLEPDGTLEGWRKRDESMSTIVIQRCGDCHRTWIQTAEGELLITAEAVEEALADGAKVIHAERPADPGDQDLIRFGERGDVPPDQRDGRVSRRIRITVLAREGGLCGICGCDIHLDGHHLIAVCQGGKNGVQFLISACKKCHQLAHQGLLIVRIGYDGRIRAYDREGRPLNRTDAPAAYLDPDDPVHPLIRIERVVTMEGGKVQIEPRNVVSPYSTTDPLWVNPTKEVGIPAQAASTSNPAASAEAALTSKAAAAIDVADPEPARAPQAPAAPDPAPAATDPAASPIPNVVSPYSTTDPLWVNPTKEVGIPAQAASTSDPAASAASALSRKAGAALDVANPEPVPAATAPNVPVSAGACPTSSRSQPAPAAAPTPACEVQSWASADVTPCRTTDPLRVNSGSDGDGGLESIDDLPEAIPSSAWRRMRGAFDWIGSRGCFVLRPGAHLLPDPAPSARRADPKPSGPPGAPLRLDEFVGQASAVERIRLALDCAKATGEAMKHALLTGPAGLGKTSLAFLIASDLGTHLHATSAPAIETPMQLLNLLANLGERDVLLIDEIHRLPISCIEYLYGAMQDGVVDFQVAQGGNERTLHLVISPFTLIGATTDPGMLPHAMKTRFGIDRRLDPYTDEELATIVTRAAARRGMAIDPAAAQEIARRSRGTPREALTLLGCTIEIAVRDGAAGIETAHAIEAARIEGLDEEGLRKEHLEILRLLVGRDHPMGIRSIATALDLDERSVAADYEPFLFRRGYITRTLRGRVATEKAKARVA